jgi:hypothetical protein
MAHRLLSTARKLERLLWNGVKRGNIDTSLVNMFISFIYARNEHVVEVIKENYNKRSRGIGIGVATGYGLDGRGSEFSLRRLNRPWGLPSLLSNGYRGLFPQG